MPSFNPTPGLAIPVAPGVTRILAPNPSPMTYRGTNSYVLGQDRLTVIDPGPASDAHLAALMDAIAHRPVDQIVVTHSHLDHSPLAAALSGLCGAPILAFGGPTAGQSPVMQSLAAQASLGGGEGIDHSFRPTQTVTDRQTIATNAGPLTVHHTPGHLGNHICLQLGQVLFSGDHIMGWSSSLISPPDGDLTDFMASCAKVAALTCTTYLPGHGAPITDPHTRVTDLIAHRRTREAQILTAITAPMTPAQITQAVYTDLAPALLPAANRNVLAHLIDLTQRGILTPHGPLTANTKFEPAPCGPSPTKNFANTP